MTPHADFLAEPQNGVSPAVQEPQPTTNGYHHLNGNTDGPRPAENRSHLRHTPEDELHDLVCVGFGPASLAIAVALHDAVDGVDPSLDLPDLRRRAPKVAFLEKQPQFAWHSGMLIPGAHMQISFMKDMATMRNPRSEFTFINYLHKNQRLIDFMNLDTFLPARVEYEDYMRWCARWFDDVVDYNQEVVRIVPEKSSSGSEKIETFVVMSRDNKTGVLQSRRTKHVVIAAGGRPNIPKPFPQQHPRVLHSSQFIHMSKRLFSNPLHPYRVAVVGSGQSAAEIFDYVNSNYPNAHTRLLIRSGALKPSDDSPFVNEIFNPSRVDCTYNRSPELRAQTLALDKNTNYGVVRLNLIERIYEGLYLQKIKYGQSPEAEQQWPHRILPYRSILDVENSPVIADGIRLRLQDSSPKYLSGVPNASDKEEVLDVDVVFVATGYKRDFHETLLGDAKNLRSGGEEANGEWQVSREYKVQFDKQSVSDDAGIWLQGCCEKSHGLSDTLLSILAARGGQMVKSIFKGQ
ncbi:L-ornithine 5-monooxygenase (L-ornithine N(5)-oxygenase) [Delitschia confertaspora ATCC 74209]|uniref:L-ornithine N(5)-monooxygenase [NAD(P)H] n=1 Tax=Delitschia confertaspora ATCC 74209 TaxID=1513339 RepID=A0A9P4JWE5_9PLEO|nr:L-ornithine 5-monooxygenase (L-ornithine N(5)-oxygenase) [Delitschia confertaspora ATCC 74209]